ncbi:amino acid permease [Solimicrobium silvestre]|uniref:Amino acid transporter n=1 Tax=Solimicrobium silvestre TaxID=2099400 RepID=A0A2S9H0B6_9BURK|nr:amino acid permease [Solimicrobium silvestre]PRC93390.1 Amino acid transporter [Solimicrobium silvestre]
MSISTKLSTPSLFERMLRTKPIDAMPTHGEEATGGLHRTIGLFQLTMFGVGATIGSGIFVILGDAVPKAGPGVILSFIIAGITAALTALCYAELASSIPSTGSSYSYTYATMGEMVAYLVGWCLLLEYGISTSAIAVGWGQYLNELSFDLLGMRMPAAIANPPGVNGGIFNLPAVVLVFMCCVLLLRGTKESARVNAIMVVVKIAVLIMFILIGLTAFHSSNLHPFMPMGMSGVGAAASSIFFSYIGLDTIATASDEVKNPKRTLPLAILFSLAIVTAVYVLVAIVGVGSQPYTEFNGNEAGLVQILRRITGATWPGVILAMGAVISIFSITLVTLYGQTRILYAMARDGMLPKIFAKVDAHTKTPRKNTVIVGTLVAIAAALLPLDVLADLTSMGTLVAFAIVSTGVIILRRTRPDLPRGFKVPFYPLFPILSVLFCIYLIADLPTHTFTLFAVWLSFALIFYFSYSMRNSKLENV